MGLRKNKCHFGCDSTWRTHCCGALLRAASRLFSTRGGRVAIRQASARMPTRHARVRAPHLPTSKKVDLLLGNPYVWGRSRQFAENH